MFRSLQRAASGFVINTTRGSIKMKFRADAAPETVKHMEKVIKSGKYSEENLPPGHLPKFYNGNIVQKQWTNFHSLTDRRVLNCGVYGSNPKTVEEPFNNKWPSCDFNNKEPTEELQVNESGTEPRISNLRGTVSMFHWDERHSKGDTEFFINLANNNFLDDGYGGFCVFAGIEDEESYQIMDAIAAELTGDYNVEGSFEHPVKSIELMD
jgi:cyclophilin family peptidyl-prolyl cis-trans isomerase